MEQQPHFSLQDALLLAGVVLLSLIGINQYSYGLYNHYITIPFIKDSIDPSLYPGDYLVEQKKYLYTYFISVSAFLVKTLHISLPLLFFLAYCVFLYLTFIAFFRLALLLFQSKGVAWFAVLFLLFAFTVPGGVRTVESSLLERTVALPFLLFAIHAFLRKKIIIACSWIGVAFLFHPLSAVHVLSGLSLCALVYMREIGLKKIIVGFMVLLILISPVLYLKVINPAPSFHLIKADPLWIELLHVRSAHHLFPSHWSRLFLLKFILFLIGFVVCMRYRPDDVWRHRAVVVFCLGIILLCIVGTVFTEIYPVAIVVQFQFWRSFVFLVYFGIFYYASYFFRALPEQGRWPEKLVMLSCLVAIYTGEPKIKLLSFLVVILLLFSGYLLLQTRPRLRPYYQGALTVVLVGITVGSMFMRKGFTIYTHQEPTWLAVQQWAAQHTPKDAVFIVPPYLEGFRVESERTIWGDWKDGTQMFFNPEFGREWIRRMQLLGYRQGIKLQDAYEQLSEKDFIRISDELKSYSKVFVVVPLPKSLNRFPKVLENKKFRVYQADTTGLADVTQVHLVKDGSHKLVSQSTQIGDGCFIFLFDDDIGREYTDYFFHRAD
ncbi:MAG: hypothetical protein KatS3mg031_0087 [Chitinophagales bacterium]|nr:MAG: hypothetical protein KatS3mg031_0087 [Chitinophagales bacterium]